MSDAEAVKEESIEPGVINAYMDTADDTLTRQDHREYLKARYEQVKAGYKSLLLQKAEAEKSGLPKEVLAKLTEQFNENYKARKYVVRGLRELGEKVEDKFIVS